MYILRSCCYVIHTVGKRLYIISHKLCTQHHTMHIIAQTCVRLTVFEENSLQAAEVGHFLRVNTDLTCNNSKNNITYNMMRLLKHNI